MDPIVFDVVVRVALLLLGAGLGAVGYHVRRGSRRESRLDTVEDAVKNLEQRANEDRAHNAREIARVRENYMHKGEAVARFRVLDDIQRAIARIESRVDRLAVRD